MRRTILTAAAALALAALGGTARGGEGPELGEILDNAKVVRLVKTGFSDEIILKKIGISTCRFDVSVDALEKLQKAGVSEKIVGLMIDRARKGHGELGTVVQAMTNFFQQGTEASVLRALDLARMHGAKLVPFMLEPLTDKHERVRAGFCVALGEVGGPEVRDALWAKLRDDAQVVRSSAARAIARISNDARTRAECLRHLRDAAGGLRDGYARALGHMRATEALGDLIRLLDEKRESEELRTACAVALGVLKDKKGFDVLARTVLETRGSAAVRQAAGDALWALGDPRAISVLLRAWDRWPSDHVALARQLGAFRDPRVVERLIAALGQGENRELVSVAHESLKKITGESFEAEREMPLHEKWKSWWAIVKGTPDWQPKAPGGAEVAPRP